MESEHAHPLASALKAVAGALDRQAQTLAGAVKYLTESAPLTPH